MQRWELEQRTRGYETWQEMTKDPEGEFVFYADAQAALAEKERIIKTADENLIAAAEKAGIPYTGCDTPDWLAETIVELRRESGALKAEMQRREDR